MKGGARAGAQFSKAAMAKMKMNKVILQKTGMPCTGSLSEEKESRNDKVEQEGWSKYHGEY